MLVLAQRLGAKGFERHPAAVSQLAQPRLVCLQAHAADRFQRQRVKTLSGKLAIQQRTEQRAGGVAPTADPRHHPLGHQLPVRHRQLAAATGAG